MHPTILIGLDGATFAVLDALIAEGQMPRLKAFIEDGVRAELLSTPQPLTPPAWTTLMTGRSPGSHGIFDFIWAEERGDQAYFTMNSFRDIKVETIWTIVSRLGGSATSLNFPLMAPPPALNGTVIPGLVSWKHLRRSVYPREIFAEIKQLPGFNAREVAWDFEREKRATKVVPAEEREEWIHFHIRREVHWFQIYRHLRENRRTDLTAILIDGIDKIQHICWESLDPDCIPEDPSKEQRLHRKLCLEYFARVDAFLGEVIDDAGPDARIFMASDHGFGPTRHVFRVNKWLEQNGYLSWGMDGQVDDAERAKLEKMTQGHFVHLDWEKTTAYAQSSATNGIHIRVARRPGESGVPLAEYESFRDRLIEQLLASRDPETGIQVVTQVMKKEDVFAGAHNARCADLTLVLHDHGFVSTLDKLPIHWGRPDVAGTHRPQGVFLARGPGIRRGAKLPLQSILDTAPTLLHSLGLPIPADFEGSVIRDAFETSWLDANAVRTGGATLAPQTYATKAAEASSDADEEEIILNRLRSLGYVE